SWALQLPAGSHSQSTPDRPGVAQRPPFLAKLQVAHRAGTGRILFLREIIFVALPSWMRTLAPSSAIMERLCGRRIAETLGQFRPVAQHKLYGLFPSRMQITERLWVKPASSLEQQTE